MYLKNLTDSVKTRLDHDTYVILQDVAKDNDMSVSYLLRYIILDYLIKKGKIK